MRKVFVQRDKSGVLIVRLDHRLKHLPSDIWPALTAFIQTGSEGSKAEIICWLSKQKEVIKKNSSQTVFEMNYQNILKDFFPTLPKISLEWGKRGKHGQQKSIRLASFWPHKKRIVLHPFLMDSSIPIFYIEYLIFHELCHAYLIFTGKAADTKHHGPEFIELETKYPHIKKAIQWEKKDLADLLNIFFK